MIATGFFQLVSTALWEWRWPLAVVMALAFAVQLRRARPAERLFAAVMLLYFFLIIVAYWVLKPIKKALFVAHYKTTPGDFLGLALEPAQMELLAKELNVLVALAAALLLAWLSRRRSALAYALTVTGAYLLALLLFRGGMDSPGAAYVWTFYLFGDLFVTSLVAVFFSFLHEHSDVPGARRIYGLVGLGGVLGGTVGSTAVSGLNATLGAAGALDVCLAVLVGIGVVQVLAGRLIPRAPRETYAERALPPPGESAWAAMSHGARIVLHSRHLKLIAAVLFCYEVASVVMDYQFTAAVSASLEPAQFRAYFSSVFAFSNAMALLVQLFLTTWILHRWGPQSALLVMPLAVLAGSGLFLAFPVLFFASLLNTADSAFAYSIQQTARESAYVPLSRLEKYEAKAFIDIVWLRFAKGMAVLVSLAASLLLSAERAHWLGLFVIVLTIVWLAAVRHLGASFVLLSRTSRISP